MDVPFLIRHRLEELGLEQRDLACAAQVTEILALATRLGEERREHLLQRPRLAFRAGGAPLAVLADRLLVAEALPAPGAAVLVDRHRRGYSRGGGNSKRLLGTANSVVEHL